MRPHDRWGAIVAAVLINLETVRCEFGRALNDNIAQSNGQETSHNKRIILKLLQPRPLGVNFCQILGIEPPTQAAKSMFTCFDKN